ncbi:MAG: tetratricopeptide repeat protein, partial [Planctomycetes bacterium]|nr:tetratricopeptide repeat protein [Planctomycetota bacterium]
ILARPDGVIRKVWRRVRKRAVSVGLAVALLAAVAAAGWLVVQSGSDRQLTALTKEFEEGINAEEWPSGHRENLEALTDRLAASAPDQADSARKRLTERATKRFRDGLQRARVEITDVPALEAELAWIAARDAEVGVTLNRELRDRLRGWRPILDLTSPFDRVAESFSPELVAVEAGQLRRVRRERMPPNVPTRTSSRGPLKVEVDFAPGWEDGTGYGVVFHLPMAPGASPNSGYTFRVVPVIRKTASDAQGAAANPSGNIATFRNPDATVRAEILRDGVVLREYEARPRVGSLRLAAERAGAVLRFRVNDEPQFEFVDAFPLGGDDTTVLGVLWSPQAAITRLQIQTQSLPSSASPLERADDLFDRGQFVEAVAIYQRATTDPATAAEALCKAGMCYVNVKRTNEALPLLENAMTQKGDRWPAIAACQLWLLFLESGRYDEAETALASTSAKFTPEQLARHVSHATRNKILSLYTSTKVNYFAPDVDLVRRSEAAVRISRLLDEEAGEQHNKQYQLLLALAVTGDYVQAREVGRQYMPFAMDQTATHPAALDTFPWAMRWYCWMMRQTGKAGEARTDLVRWRDEYLPRSPAGSPAWFRWSYMPMHLEFARINAEEQKINAAEWEIDVYLKDSPRPIHNYSFHAPAYLMKGFCRLEQGDAAGAVKAWDQGRWQSYTAEWKDGKRPPQPTPPGRNALMDHWMLSSLCDKLTDAEAKDVLRDLMAMLVQDQTMTQMAGIIQLSPDVLRNAWRSPRGRELARKMAFLQFGPVEHYRNLIRVLIYEKFRQELCDGKPSPEQDEVLWDGVLRLGNLFFDRKLSKAQLFPAALGWKGTIGVLGWGGVAHQLPPDTRGPVAYVLGLRYLKLNKPADAKMLFRTAVTDSAASSAVNRLATEEIAKLDGKPGPTLLPVAPPPRERR